MHLVVFTHTPIITIHSKLYAYAPYVREMNLWFAYSDKVTIVCPTKYDRTLLKAPFKNQDIRIVSIPSLYFKSKYIIKSLIKLPFVFKSIFRQMRSADHIHIRCPGNVGLIACIIQVFFPKKIKTAKYAGNWDPNAKQPWSYRLQKWVLKNTFFTKNMTVLVYGEWKNQTKNIKPFFTASYREKDKTTIVKDYKPSFCFMFVGSLVPGKRPEYAISLVKKLKEEGEDVTLDIYGDGALREALEKKSLDGITFHKNQEAAIVQQAYKKAHFLILTSKSEGWPKAIAEAMFYGVIPIVTPISCVPWIIGQGERGILVSLKLDKDVQLIRRLLYDQSRSLKMSRLGQEWSQQFTLDSFEQAISKLLR